MQRVAIPLVLLAILGFTVWWLWTTRPQPAEPSAVAATPTVAAAVPEPEVAGPPPGFRLAGLAIGEPDSFAAIELPDGKSQLYRIDSDVPGLGRIVDITEAGVLIEGENGRFTLQLKPAATATPDQRRVNGEEAEDDSTTAPERPGGRDDTALEPTA